MLYILSEMFCLQKGEDTRAGKMEDLSKKEKKSLPYPLTLSLMSCLIP